MRIRPIVVIEGGLATMTHPGCGHPVVLDLDEHEGDGVLTFRVSLREDS